MKFTGHLTGAKLDLQAYKSELDKYLEKVLRQAANAWLRGVTGRVPVWSGMAKASLLELSEMVNGNVVITPRVKSRIPLGRSLGTAVRDDFTITITTKVPHYTLQEHTNVGVSRSAPWQSLQRGAEYYKQVEVTLPKPVFKPKKYNV